MKTSEEAISLTAMAANFAEDDVSRDMLLKVLVTTKYMADIKTITQKGLDAGISYYKSENGKRWPVYPQPFQEKLGKNIEWMKEKFPELRLSAMPKKEEKPAKSTKQDVPIPSSEAGSKYKYLNLPEFVIIDTETTGVDEDDEVVELAVVSDKGETLYHSYYYPEKEVNPKASEVNHLTRKKLEGNPKLDNTEWAKIKEAVGDRYIMGHNISFDKRLVIQTIVKNNGDVGDVNAVFANLIDSMTIAKKYMTSKSYALNNLTTMVGITREEQHDATDDCIMTLEFIDRLEDIIKIMKEYPSFMKIS